MCAYPSLHLPSVVLNRVEAPEEQQDEGAHDAHSEYFEVQIINSADFPLIIPHNTQVGVCEEVAEVREVAEDLATFEGAEAYVSALSGSRMGGEGESAGLNTFHSPKEDLQDFVVEDEDREPDTTPPSLLRLKELAKGLKLNQKQKEEFLALLERYQHVFAVNPSVPEEAGVTPHTIDLQPGTKPVFKHQYRMSGVKREEIARQVKEKLDAGMIQRSKSSFSAPVVLAPKHDGTWRFCVDYRELNKVTIPDKFPLPRIDDLLDKLGGNVFFSTMDLAAGFYQIPVAAEDRHKTAFATHEGLFEWVRMPMGLTNSPATFQRAMNLTLAGLNWATCLVYLDDIICFSRSFEEHLESLENIFERLLQGGFSLKLSKCTFFQEEVEYLGHVVGKEGRRPHPRNLAAVKDFPRPSGKSFVTNIQAFVGLTNYYAAYIPDYVQKREPLTRLTKQGIANVWGPEQEECFELLKRDLCAAPLLRHPDFEKRFYIQTDACGYGIGAVLTQEYEDGFHPILYLSRSLTEPEKKWAARELEALAVVWAVTKLRPYIEGRRFTVQTDHESLQWLMRTEAPGRLSRWAMKLQEFMPLMDIEYRRGEDNGNADALSRCPLASLKVAKAVAFALERFYVQSALFEEFNSLMFEANAEPEWARRVCPDELSEVCVSSVSLSPMNDEEKMEEDTEEGENEGVGHESLMSGGFQESVEAGYQTDAKWRDLIAYLGDPETPEISDAERKDMAYRAEHFFVRDGLLYLRSFWRRNNKDPRKKIERLVIPDSLRYFLLAQLHDSPSGAHMGSGRVSFALRRRYYWPGIDREVREYVKTCPNCQRAKATRQRRAGLLQPKGWDRPGALSVDLQGPFPKSHGFNMVLTIKDVFLGLTVLVPLNSDKNNGTDAAHVADAIFTHWVKYFGVPRIILTDRGPQFVADLFERFCKRLGIDHKLTATYHPQTNSQAERQHGFHTPLIKAFCEGNPHAWSRFLPYLQFGVNSSVMEGYGISPLEAMSGYEPLLPSDLYLLPEDDSSFVYDKHQHKIEHPKRMKMIHALMSRVKKERDGKMKERYDETHKDVRYEVGDKVLAFKPAVVVGSRKLAINWRGPFEVTRVIGPNSYRIRLCGREDLADWTANVQNMVRFHTRHPARQNTWLDVDTELPSPVRAPRVDRRHATRGEVNERADEEEREKKEEQEEEKSDEQQEEESVLLKNALLAHVFIAPSPGRGRGVYGRAGLKKDTVLGEYTGRRISGGQHEKEAKAGKDTAYCLELDDVDVVIDASDFREAKWPRYMNAAGPGETPNVHMMEVNGRAMVLAAKDIEQGEELLVDYGQNYEWSTPPVSQDKKRRIKVPRASPMAHAFKKQVRAVVEDEVLAAPQEQKEMAARANVAAIPDDIEIGKFILVMHEPAPTTLELGEVISVDELRQSATVHTWGNYSGDVKKAFAPCWVDPKDNKWSFTRKPKKSWLPSQRTLSDEHIRTYAFDLKRGFKLPKALQEVDWAIADDAAV
jgi:hypothetical protein